MGQTLVRKFSGSLSIYRRQLRSMLEELAFQVLEVYRVLDKTVAGFSARAGLACPKGCGHCCLSEKVEATVLECIPLAFELFRTFQAELILKRLEKNENEKRCILYRSDYAETGFLGCTQYQYRAVVCRLFGFAGDRDRDGILRLAMCRVMKEEAGSGLFTITIDDPDIPMPLFVDAGLRITTLHPGLGTERLSINIALREALLKVGIMLQLRPFESFAAQSHLEEPPHEPTFPSSTLGRQAA